MRWENTEVTLKPRIGETRVVRKFLILPRTFNSTKTRWLEYAYIVEQVKELSGADWSYYLGWGEIAFADEYFKKEK